VPWIDRLAAAVAWQPLDIRTAWEPIESELGTRLPQDYKTFCEAFGPGQFSGCVSVFPGTGDEGRSLVSQMATLRKMAHKHPVVRSQYLPYRLFLPEEGGLIQWGETELGSTFYWLTDERDPDRWPIVAMPECGGWRRFDLSMSEFLFHGLTDTEIAEFTLADAVAPPFFAPA
jgi:hypothetical protein